MVTVFAFEGAHGSGKTFVVNKLKKKFLGLDEGFITNRRAFFDPQGFYRETQWGMSWLRRLEDICTPYYDTDKKMFKDEGVIITDRSPYSSCVYAKKHGIHAKKVFDISLKEFKEKGVNLYIIYLDGDKDKLMKRILERLEREPERKELNEDSKDHLEDVIRRYKLFDDCWDKKVDIDDEGTLIERIHEFIQTKIGLK